MRKVAEFVGAVAGIYSTFLCAGVLQERLYHRSFNSPVFQVFCQYVISLLVSRLFMTLTHIDRQVLEFSPLKAAHALVSSIAILLTNSSLTYVSYPTQILAKSCKVLPVMLGGLFIKHHQYTSLQYLSVAFVTIGIVTFNMMGAKSGGTDTAIGLSLLFAALMADGFSSYYTERVRKEHHPDGLAIMDYCNYYGLFLVTPVLVVTEWMKPQSCMVYIAEQPDILYDIMTYCFIR
mmetsp:Transcript_32238/g.55733  ORF Transcript_32238/g.55733 Transcript_32238/m.55733 type:complete len:234 (+) Transcript_32238:66-767(+)